MFSDNLRFSTASIDGRTSKSDGLRRRGVKPQSYIRLRQIKVQKLFGQFDYDIALKNDDRITILTAPNGFGKSTILRMVNSLIDGDFDALRKITFNAISLLFEDGQSISVNRKVGTCKGSLYSVRIETNGTGKTYKLDQNVRFGSRFEEALRTSSHLPFIRQLSEDEYIDERRGVVMDSMELVRRYGLRFMDEERLRIPAKQALRNKLPTIYIPADRLYLQSTFEGRHGERNQMSSVSEINLMAKNLASDAINNYAQHASRIDQNFTARLLDSVNQDSEVSGVPSSDSLRQLEDQERNVKMLETRLQRLGLLDSSDKSPGSAKTVNTMAAVRVLKLHFDDMADKYSSLLDVASRIELFLEFLSTMFSFKTVNFSLERGLYLKSDSGDDLSLDALASGEQHLLVLYGRLLFGNDVPLVLLDEPEISLHLEWQMKFLSHMEKIADLHPFDLIIATHSPYLIDGRDELMVELSEMVV